MFFGCLVLLGLFGVALYLALAQVQALALPWPWLPATILALGATLTLGGLQGLWQAWRRRDDAHREPVELVDGTTVRLGGVLRPTGDPLAAPFTGAAAVFLEYESTSPDGINDATQRQPRFNGVRAAPCELQTRLRRLRLRGIPSLREFPERQYRGAPHDAGAARLLAGTAWRHAPDVATLDLHAARSAFAGGSPGMDLINREALERLRLEIGRTTESELLQRLQEHRWLFRERIVPPSVPVTVVGTYRAAAQAVDIGVDPTRPEQGLHPGGAVDLAGRQFRQAAVFVAVLAALTAAAHWVVLGDAGSLWRRIVQALGPMD